MVKRNKLHFITSFYWKKNSEKYSLEKVQKTKCLNCNWYLFYALFCVLFPFCSGDTLLFLIFFFLQSLPLFTNMLSAECRESSVALLKQSLCEYVTSPAYIHHLPCNQRVLRTKVDILHTVITFNLNVKSFL